MQYNALIIDHRIEHKVPDKDWPPELKQMVCRLDGTDRLTRMYDAADKMAERPCLCLVVTDQPETAELALTGGFDVATTEELVAIHS